MQLQGLPAGNRTRILLWTVTFFATGPGLGIIMYIFTTLEFPTHNFVRHPCIKFEIICLPLYWPVAMPSCHFHSVHYNVLILEAIHL